VSLFGAEQLVVERFVAVRLVVVEEPDLSEPEDSAKSLMSSDQIAEEVVGPGL